jgi:plasmid stability protein
MSDSISLSRGEITMKTITLRGVPDEVYAFLRGLAARNRRSMQEQVKCLLEQEARLLQASTVAVALEWRQRLDGRAWGDVVDDVRLERAR